MTREPRGKVLVLSEELSCRSLYKITCQHCAALLEKESSVEKQDNCRDTSLFILFKWPLELVLNAYF